MNNDQKKCPVTHLTTDFGAPVVDNQNSMTAGARGPLLAQDLWLNEKLANFVREVIPERRMHAKGSGAFGTFTVTHDITQYSCAKIFSEIGKQTPMFARFTTVAGERGAADAERDIRGFALKFYTEEGSQFTSDAFIDVLKSNGIQISMDGKGRWVDNVMVERLWRSVKYEEVYLKAYSSVTDAKKQLSAYFEFYNLKRPHSSLDKMTPDEFYYDQLPQQNKVA